MRRIIRILSIYILKFRPSGFGYPIPGNSSAEEAVV